MHAAAAGKAQQEGLGLIIPVMRGDDGVHTIFPGGLGHQTVSRRTGSGLKAVFRFVTAPAQDPARQADSLSPAGDALAFPGSFRSQTMINAVDQHMRPVA